MGRVARLNSRELFLISVVATGLGVGYGTYIFGLSFAFGAFVAGIVLSQSDYSHQALADIGPLRDVFAMLFFVSVGMLIDPAFLLDSAPVVLAVVLAVFVGKGLIFAGVARAFGYVNIVPVRRRPRPLQVGEFSFLLARSGRSEGVISSSTYSIALTTAVVTMALTPFAARAASPLYARWRARFPAPAPKTVDLPEGELTDHVIVVGFGRVGGFVARMLQRLEQPFVVVDVDPNKVEVAREEGIPLVYGDAAAEPVLEAAKIRSARMVVLATSTPSGRASWSRGRRPSTRTRASWPARPGEEQLEDLGRLGVYEVVQPELEAGLELARQALINQGFGAAEVQRFSDGVRREMYAPISDGDGATTALARLRRASRMIESDWIEVPKKSALAGRAIGELGVRARTGASIVALLRGDEAITNPGPDLPSSRRHGERRRHRRHAPPFSPSRRVELVSPLASLRHLGLAASPRLFCAASASKSGLLRFGCGARTGLRPPPATLGCSAAQVRSHASNNPRAARRSRNRLQLQASGFPGDGGRFTSSAVPDDSQRADSINAQARDIQPFG
jgi:CPA2 family monovalent cation:H+ antiporter-2